MIERCNTSNDDSYFELPGGHLEANEDIFDAMIRGVKEELKLNHKRTNIKLVHITHHYTGERINCIFKSTKKINHIIGEPNKCSKLDWFYINHLSSNTTDKVKKCYRHIMKI